MVKILSISGEDVPISIGDATSIGDLQECISKDLGISGKRIFLFDVQESSERAPLNDDTPLDSLSEIQMAINFPKYIDDGKDGTKRDIYDDSDGNYDINCDNIEDRLQQWNFQKHTLCMNAIDSSDDEQGFEYDPDSDSDEWEIVIDRQNWKGGHETVHRRTGQHDGEYIRDFDAFVGRVHKCYAQAGKPSAATSEEVPSGNIQEDTNAAPILANPFSYQLPCASRVRTVFPTFFTTWYRACRRRAHQRRVGVDRNLSKEMAYWLRYADPVQLPGKQIDGWIEIAELQQALSNSSSEDNIKKTARTSKHLYGKRFELSRDARWIRSAR
jgi:hypothetical protein